MIHPFDTNDRNNVNKRWLQYAAFLNVYFSNANITDDNVKKQQLQLYGGPALANLIERKTTKTTYKELVEEVATLASNSTNATTEFRRITQFVTLGLFTTCVTTPQANNKVNIQFIVGC